MLDRFAHAVRRRAAEPVHGDLPRLRLTVILPTVAVTALCFLFVIARAHGPAPAARHRAPALLDAEGVARNPIAPAAGTVSVLGEIWRAESAERSPPAKRCR
jgi:membrane protein implicated in regulation of membrane protease activity